MCEAAAEPLPDWPCRLESSLRHRAPRPTADVAREGSVLSKLGLREKAVPSLCVGGSVAEPLAVQAMQETELPKPWTCYKGRSLEELVHVGDASSGPHRHWKYCVLPPV